MNSGRNWGRPNALGDLWSTMLSDVKWGFSGFGRSASDSVSVLWVLGLIFLIAWCFPLGFRLLSWSPRAIGAGP